jgi:hypothetical protein
MSATSTATDTAIQAFALNSGWTNANYVPTETAGASLSQTVSYGSTTWYPCWSYPVYVTSPARPIKLTLSEIDKLRKVAKGDKAIQAILEKFTDQIEIAVDFK